jgi:hypothetical protein
MNPLVKTAIKAGIAGAAGIGLATAVDKFYPLKDKTGTVTPLNPLGGFDVKKVGKLAAIIAAGGAVVYFAAKLLKINFLKN